MAEFFDYIAIGVGRAGWVGLVVRKTGGSATGFELGGREFETVRARLSGLATFLKIAVSNEITEFKVVIVGWGPIVRSAFQQ